MFGGDRPPHGGDLMPTDPSSGVPPELEEISDRAPPGGGAATPSASPPREAGKVRRSYLTSSWVPRKGSGFPSPASSLRPLTGSWGGGVGWVGSLRAGWVANTPRPVQSDCVGSTLSSLAPFRSPATQPKCGAGRGSCSS